MDDWVRELTGRIAGMRSVIVAFSGGVDSSVVAALAQRALGERALAVTAVSPALASGELESAREVANAIGIAHEVINTAELERAGYRDNSRFRCHFCKTELYERLGALAAERGFATVVSGANADDTGDWRPGLRAAAEHGVRHPLLEAGVRKAEVRELARRFSLPSAEKPAAPCLASRLPYGTEVTLSALGQIDRAELAMKSLGYQVFRVRHYGDMGRVELAAAELAALTPAHRAEIESAVLAAGYRQVEISDQPFRSGSLNLL